MSEEPGGSPVFERVLFGARVAATGGGVALLLVAFLADRLGLGTEGSVGFGQVLLGILGAILLLAGALGRRFADFYRDSATILLTAILMVFSLELVAIVLGRMYFRTNVTTVEELPYYASQEWSGTYWREALAAERMRYAPFLGWKHQPFSGETVNFDEDGKRPTPGATCGDSSFRVFVFGGSTLVGWGAPDWGTIPAFLQQALSASVERPVCVLNLGEDGYVSTQELIQLVLRLQEGDVPDAVIFYDGINEVIAAAEAGVPGTHVTLERLAARFEQQEHPLVTWLASTRLYSMASRITTGGRALQTEAQYRHPEVDPVELGRAVAHRYLENYELVQALSHSYGFGFAFFVQPHLALTQKPLTPEEGLMRGRIGAAFEQLARSFYRKVRLAAPELQCLWDLSAALDARVEQVFIDTTGHVTPEGNRVIAESILGRVGERRPCLQPTS